MRSSATEAVFLISETIQIRYASVANIITEHFSDNPLQLFDFAVRCPS